MKVELFGKILDPDNMEVLYSQPFTDETVKRDFQVMGGQWSIKDGWLTGENRKGSAMLLSRMEFNTDLFIDFRARTVLPSTHDIDFMFNAKWDYEADYPGLGYIFGISGWWDAKTGFERTPDYAFKAYTKLFKFEPGRIYHVQIGNINGHLFCLIDDELIIEAHDPNPIDVKTHGFIAFESYESHVQYTDFSVKRAVYSEIVKKYKPEF